MKRSIVKHFIKSLELPSTFDITIKNVRNIDLTTVTHNSIRLYHGVNNSDYETVVDSITKEGFKYDKTCYKNKGVGIYFSSHARYQYLWLGTRSPVIVCDILFDTNNENGIDEISKYHAEVSIGYEYKITNPKLIVPRVLIEYDIVGDIMELDEIEIYHSVYRPLGKSGCKKCDSRMLNCHCKIPL